MPGAMPGSISTGITSNPCNNLAGLAISFHLTDAENKAQKG